MRVTRRGWLVAGLVAALTVLVGSVLAAVAWGGTWNTSPRGSVRMGSEFGSSGFRSDRAPAARALPGTVVGVTLTSMGTAMMGNGADVGGMSLRTDRATAPNGTVSFLVTNAGMIDHELVVLPLAEGQVVGTRAIGPAVNGKPGKVDEAASLGEASKTDGQGAGEGIRPGASGWVSLTLAPGRYELLCNLPGHYGAGMYAELSVV